MKVLFVCTGNICRSPTAEVILQKMTARQNWTIESAGVSDYHAGETADKRALAAAAKRGYDMSAMRARQVREEDFYRHDIIFAMAREHLDFLRAMSPKNASAKLRLFLSDANADIPDPYYGGDAGFSHMLDLLEDGCRAILQENAPP